MSSIYRKYRPKTFAEMVGQSHIKLTLLNELQNDSFVHAYLFTGPRGLGKTTAARLFAKAVNCENRKKSEGEPCNKCSSCLEINEGKSFDVIEIDAASHTGVDNVRENIIENVRFSPNKSTFKIFIIDEVHMLSLPAFNALLKTLEEPPAHAIFILCTTEIHKVPETIISRCQRFDFKKVAAAEAIKRLKRIAQEEGIKIDDEVYDLIARKSEGCMRDAESLLGQVFSLGGKKITKEQVALILPSSAAVMVIDFLGLVLANQTGDSIEFINKISEEGIDLEIFAKEVVEFLRKMILLKLNVVKSEWLGLPEGEANEIMRLVDLNGVVKLAEVTKAFLVAAAELKNSQIAQLPLELAIVKVCEENAPASMSFFTKNIKRESDFNTKNSEAHKTEINSHDKTDQAREPESSKINNEDLSIFRDNWQKIILESHKKSTDLLFINDKMMWPISFDGEELMVGFKYDLHKGRFESKTNKQIFAEVIQRATNKKIKLAARILKPSELVDLEIAEESKFNSENPISGVAVTDENILDQVLSSFGGEVVDR